MLQVAASFRWVAGMTPAQAFMQSRELGYTSKDLLLYLSLPYSSAVFELSLIDLARAWSRSEVQSNP
jgi:hypothetical protein